MRSVVITGVGIASSFGVGLDALAAGLRNQQSCLRFDPSEPTQKLIGAPIARLDLPKSEHKRWFDPRSLRLATMTRATLLTTIATGDALMQAGLDDGKAREDAGCYVGYFVMPPDFSRALRTATISARNDGGRFAFNDERLADALRSQSAFDFLRNLPNMPGAHVGIRAQFLGLSNTYLGTEASGLQAIHAAVEDIRDGQADMMLAGGVGAPLDELFLAWMIRHGQVPGPEQPFASDSRRGPGEAAAFVLLEDEEKARARGARVLARVTGGAVGFGADPISSIEARAHTLKAAWPAKERPDLVVPGLRGYSSEDELEYAAWSKVYQDGLLALDTASILGNTGAAAGALNVVAALVSLTEGFLPQSGHGASQRTPFDFAGIYRHQARTALVSIGSSEGVSAAVSLERCD